MDILIPQSLNLKSTIRFVNKMSSFPKKKEYNFNFGELKWIEPFSLLYLSFCINRFSRKHNKSNIYVSNYDATNATNYAGHMGFFQSFGIDAGKFPSEATGNCNYIPIKLFRIKIWQRAAKQDRKPIGEIIETESRQLSEVLTRETKGKLVDTIEFTLREIIRNVAEHSKAKQVGFVAQYWPRKEYVELAILDSGIGFKKSLSKNPFLEKEMSDNAALNYALLPGVSGKMFKGKYKDPYDEWENSGFGLYMASEICRNGGSFFACSGTAGTLLVKAKKENIKMSYPCTAIRLRLATRQLKPTADALSKYHKKGEKVAKKIHGANISASAASTMLARDFG